MSIDKEELMEVLKACNQISYNLEDEWLRNLAMNTLRGVIALIEIRESIDRLRMTIEDTGKKIDDVSGELALIRESRSLS